MWMNKSLLFQENIGRCQRVNMALEHWENENTKLGRFVKNGNDTF